MVSQRAVTKAAHTTLVVAAGHGPTTRLRMTHKAGPHKASKGTVIESAHMAGAQMASLRTVTKTAHTALMVTVDNNPTIVLCTMHKEPHKFTTQMTTQEAQSSTCYDKSHMSRQVTHAYGISIPTLGICETTKSKDLM